MSSNGALRASQKYFTCLGKVFLRLLEAAFLLSFFFFPSHFFDCGIQDCLEVELIDLCLCECFKLHRDRLSPLTMVL